MYLVQKITLTKSMHHTISRNLFNSSLAARLHELILIETCGDFDNVEVFDLEIEDSNEKIKVEPFDVFDCEFTSNHLELNFYLTEDIYINIFYDFDFTVFDFENRDFENVVKFGLVEFEIDNNKDIFFLDKEIENEILNFGLNYIEERDIEAEIFDRLKENHLSYSPDDIDMSEDYV